MGKQGLYYEDYEVGAEYETASRTITEADVVMFAGLTGDYNPLHVDEEFAKSTPFGRRIAHGALVFSYAGGLVNQLGHGEGTAIGLLETGFKMPAPVAIGDTITVTVRIQDKKPTSKPGRGIVFEEILVKNQRGEVVLEEKTTLMVRTRAGAG